MLHEWVTEQRVFLLEVCEGKPSLLRDCEKIFSVFRPYEEQWDADFTEMPGDTLQKIFNEQIFGARHLNASRFLSCVRLYAAWRMETDLPCCQDVLHLRDDTTVSILKSMPSSPLHLLSSLNCAFDSPAAGTTDALYRTYLWLAYAGLPDSQAVRVTNAQVDMRSLTVSSEGASYPLYRESLQDLLAALELESFTDPMTRSGTRTSRVFSRLPGDLILRGKAFARARSTPDEILKAMRTGVTQRMKVVRTRQDAPDPGCIPCLELTYNSVRSAGEFHRMFERERAGFPPRPGIPKPLRDDYESWKSAYSTPRGK